METHLAQVLFDGEQVNCDSHDSLAFLKKSVIFSNKSSSSEDVFSYTARTSVVIMLYTTKNKGCPLGSAVRSVTTSSDAYWIQK